MDPKIKETLEKQLQLLSECSKNAFAKELPGITHAMVEIAAFLSESQERPEETHEDSEKIVPLETESRNGFFIGDLVICRALDEWAGVGKVFEVSGFYDDYDDNAAVNDGARTFVVSTRELLHIAPGATLIMDWSQYAKV